jgi:transposase InsO family protein
LQYASEDYRAVLQKHGLTGSMGRRGNPYDNAKAESFMKTPLSGALHLSSKFQTCLSASIRYSSGVSIFRLLTVSGGFFDRLLGVAILADSTPR